MSGNYPDGTSASDPRAPWNAPEIEIDYPDDLIDYIEEELEDDLFWEDDWDGGWKVELPNGEWLNVETREECILLLLFDRESWLEDKAVDRKIEQYADAQY